MNIVFIAVCAIIGGADDWVAIERFGKAKRRWFERYLPLKHGIPSHDTFGSVFGALNPTQFEAAFSSWVKMIAEPGGVVALDGKTVRRSHDKGVGKSAIHVVSAWSTANRLVMGQVKVDDKSNEITALPELLQLLVVRGCLVTIDAMGCQTDIAEKIIDGDGDYLLAVKGNHRHLQEDIVHLFKHTTPENFTNEGFDEARIVTNGHGRVEVRLCQVISHPEWLNYIRQRAAWKQLSALVKLTSERIINDKSRRETRYFICSRHASAAELCQAVRDHWQIENRLHWVLDMVFDEDRSRVRIGNAQQNLAVMRRIAINMLNQETSRKESLKGKRQLAGWDEAYLERIVFG